MGKIYPLIYIPAAILANKMALLQGGEIYAWAQGYLSTYCVPNNTISK
jgi:hypothetical protein